MENNTIPIPTDDPMALFDNGVKRFGSICMIAQTGSHAYGLNTESSDQDYRGIFTPNPRHLLGLGVVEQVKIKGDDWVCHDIRQFVKLVIKLNPTILEMLFVDPIYCDVRFFVLRGELRKLISKNVFKPYSAYVKSQLIKAERKEFIGKRKEASERLGYCPKFLSHVARLAVQGTGLLTTGKIEVKLPEPYRSIILAIKLGKYAKDAAIAYCQELDAKMYEAYKTTSLPASVDLDSFEQNVYIPYVREICKYA